jgi:short-subunit dehydrogenase
MSPEAVVEASLRGLERNQLIVVPGWHYRLLVLFLTAMPRSLLRGLSATFARRMRKKMAKAGN